MADSERLGALLWDYVYAYDAAYDAAARGLDLSAAQACLLQAVTDGPVTMGALAARLLCDASNVTQMVNRLETRELVTREPGVHDRRSRAVTATASGRRLADQMTIAFSFPDEGLARLEPRERRDLEAILVKLGGPR